MTVEEKTAAKTPARESNILYSVNRAINGAMERAFEALGRLVGRCPVLVILGMCTPSISWCHSAGSKACK